MYIFTEAKDRQSHIYNISKQLKMTWGYITINKTKQKQTNKQTNKQANKDIFAVVDAGT